MRSFRPLLPLALLSSLPAALGGDILSTNGFSMCSNNPTIQVQTLNVQYDRSTQKLTFDVAGSNSVSQKVQLNLVVSAYGKTVYTKTVDPCDITETNVTQMCPIPAGSFSSKGVQSIPDQYASQIPSIAYSVPDLDGLVKLTVKSQDGTQDLACIQSSVGNGHTFQMPAITYAAAGVAAAALGLSAVTALASGGGPGVTTPSPTFGEVIGWFQSMAATGMLSVQYPKVYQSFSTNFAFSTGLVPWGQMQTAIDNFRAKTGGNLTQNSYEYLKNNATLVFDDGTTNVSTVSRRGLDMVLIWARQTTIDVNGTSSSVGNETSTNSTTQSKEQKFVSGIQAYAEQLSIPAANTFMTILLVWAIVVAGIIVLILLAKAILEAWAQFGKLPHSLESWRKRYWWRMAKAIINLVLLLYGVWTLWCVYQFSSGEAGWATKVLAGVTLGLFTALLAGFTWKIWSLARKAKKMEGSVDKLFDDKDVWIKYSLFYDNYKKAYWWVFVPVIVYMFARGCVIAGANGHGLVQAVGQLAIELAMLILLLWSRPYQRRSGKWINFVIQTVRVISVICVLVFVEELGLTQTTKTVTGVVLIVVQTTLTGILAILIAINAIITCVKENPHRRQRKEAEKLRRSRDLDNLTALDARNSLLMSPYPTMEQQHGLAQDTSYKASLVASSPFASSRGRYDPVPYNQSREGSPDRYHDEERLVSSAAPPPFRDHHSRSISMESREPRLPEMNFGRAM